MEEDLDAFAELFETVGGLRIRIDCTDGLSRHFETISELKRFDNAPSRSIEGLDFSARAEDDLTFARLSLKNDEGRNVILTIEGEVDSVVSLNETLEARLEGMRPWYRGFAYSETGLVVFGVFLFMALGIFVGFRTGFLGFEMAQRDSSLTPVQAIGLTGAMGVIGALTLLLIRMKKWLFPIGTFTLGMGKNRYEQNEMFRRAIFIGLMVSVLGSFLVAPLF